MLRFTAFPASSRVVAAILVLAAVLALVFAQAARAAGEGISLSASQISAKDSDGTVTYTVALTGDTAPTSDVTVTVTSDNAAVGVDTDASTEGAQDTLTFTTTNYKNSQTVTLNVADDNLVSEGANISHASTSSDSAFEGLSASLRVTVTDDDVAGITLSSGSGDDAFDPSTAPIKLAEGGSGSYSVVLDHQPAGDVTVTVTSNNTDVTVDSTSLSFGTGNWDSPQTVNVSAAQDDPTDNESATLTHDVASTADAKFNAVANVTVTVEVKDDERAGVTISDPPAVNEGATVSYTVSLNQPPTANVTVTIASNNSDASPRGPDGSRVLKFTPGNYSTAQTVNVSVSTDATTDDESAMLTHTLASADSNYTNAAIIKTAGDDAVANLGSDATDDEKAAARKTAEDAARAAFTKTIQITDTTKGVKFSSGSGADAFDPSSQGLTLTEGGNSVDYTVVLRAQPLGAVTVAISSNNTAVTVGSESLLFTADNWSDAQTVTVSAVDDATTDDESATLTHTITSSADATYNAIGDATVTVTVNDDEYADVTFDNVPASLAEGAAAVSYTLRLDEEPTANVTVTITSDNPDVTVDTDSTKDGNQNVLTFNTSATGTAGSWEDPQTIRVMARIDADNADENVTLTHTFTSTDGNYTNAGLITTAGDEAVAGLGSDATDAQKAAARKTAEDAARAELALVRSVLDTGIGVRFATASANTDNSAFPAVPYFYVDETDADATDTYTVVLQQQPQHSVTVAISVRDASDFTAVVNRPTVAPASLTFTTENWNQAQTVTLTVAADSNNASEWTYIWHAVSSNDLRYDGLVVSFQAASQDDEPSITVDPSKLDAVVEGGSVTFSVKLDDDPDDPATGTTDNPNVESGTVVISSDNEDVTLMGAAGDGNLTLTFTGGSDGNHGTAQTVTVNVAADEDDLDELTTLSLTVSGGLYSLGDNGITQGLSLQVKEPAPAPVHVPGPTVTQTVTQTVTRTETVTVPAPPNVIGGTTMAMAAEVDGRVLITRHDGGPSLAIDIGGFIRDESMGQTYQVVRRADGAIVRQWVSPNSPLVYQIPWAVVNTQFSVPVGVILAIPLDDQVGSEGQLARRFDGGDDRIFSYDAGQWRHVPDIPTLQALGLYWCDVTAADSGFFDRISIGPAHPASDQPARSDYPNCSTG